MWKQRHMKESGLSFESAMFSRKGSFAVAATAAKVETKGSVYHDL